MKCIFYISISLILMICFSFDNRKAEEKDLVRYLEKNWQSPEDYVINKFKDHDYVLIGEYHRIKHDVDLILNLIPQLHKAGINNLCIEFGDYRDQHLIDSLLTLPHFDRELAKKIQFNNGPFWGYKEYIDIYKAAWEVNHSPNKKNKFRIIAFNPHYDPCKEGKGDTWRSVNPDSVMFDVIKKEVIDKKLKALIYSGSHHAFTKYYQPIYDFKSDSLCGYEYKRMGNFVNNLVGERAFNIILHYPWTSNKGWEADRILPANGSIDSVMNIVGNKRVGFDTAGSQFGKLRANGSYYALGYPDFHLEQYCDGYIFQKEIKDYVFVGLEPNFYNDNNFPRLKKYAACIGLDQDPMFSSVTVELANKLELSKETAEGHFGNLMK